MIKSLTATNFRRHADLDLRFEEDRQLILISGANGVGKSSILEAITFALWGEGRHGRRNLDNLVRRGYELEGMSVELTFTIADETYRVHRRRDGKSVTAVLYANDTPLVEGPQAVTNEIANLLGMDAAGFRLAVIAQQKDLDGLASLRPAERAQMITRLLRLDALSAAKNAAGLRFRSERDIAAELRGSDPDEHARALTESEQGLGSAVVELEAAQRALKSLNEEVSSASEARDLWERSARELARLEGAGAQLRERESELEREISDTVIPEMPERAENISVILTRVAEIERDIAESESMERTRRQQAVAREELDRVETRVLEIEQRVCELGEPEPGDALLRLENVREKLRAAYTSLEDLRAQLAALSARETDMREKAERELGSECDQCGQSVSEEHRHAQTVRLLSEADELSREAEVVKQQGREAVLVRDKLRLDEENAVVDLDRARADQKELERLHEERGELERRKRIYTSQLERENIEVKDRDDLQAERDALAKQIRQAEYYQQQYEQREQAISRRLAITESLVAVRKALGENAEAVAACAPDRILEERYKQYHEAVERQDTERGLVQHWETQVALKKAEIEYRRAQLESSLERETRRRKHQDAAIHAAAAGRLLADVSERLGSKIRPALEGAVASILGAMSEGRFGAVNISEEYTITVEDDGKFRPITELSGGEMDLVALSVRLALAQVVTDRQGAGGPGFLILDECFASQDSQRRQAILSALRNLRDVYSQIFLISHVENIEDSADTVIEVSTDEDREETEVTVT